jgi:hypothetical protein
MIFYFPILKLSSFFLILCLKLFQLTYNVKQYFTYTYQRYLKGVGPNRGALLRKIGYS